MSLLSRCEIYKVFLQSAIRNPQSAIKAPTASMRGQSDSRLRDLSPGLEAAHGFDGGLVVYAGHFAGIEAPLLERFLNLERALAVDFEGLALREGDGIIL